MARLAAQEKLLYYPTPLEMVDLIAKHILLDGVNRKTGVILDSTCGCATAVARFRDLLNERPGPDQVEMRSWQSYMRSYHLPDGKWKAHGIEPDELRAVEAKEHIGKTNVICAALEQIGLPPHSARRADMLFLNPPYDWFAGDRMERYFLKLSVPFLKRGAGIVWIVPESIVTGKQRDKTRYLFNQLNIGSVVVRRFPDPFYEKFGQVVVFGKYGGYGVRYALEEHFEPGGDLGEGINHGWDKRHSREAYRHGFLLQEQDYNVDDKRLSLLRIVDVKPKPPTIESVDDLKSFYPVIGSPGRAHLEMQPLRPMNDPHAASATVAGILNGVEVEKDGVPHVVRGSYYKTVTTKQIEKNGKQVTVHTETPVTHLALLNMRNGLISHIDGQANPVPFRDFMLTHALQLVGETRRRFPPLVTDEDVEALVPLFHEWIKAPGKLKGIDNGMLDKQAETGAVYLHAMRKLGMNSLILDGEMSVGKTLIALAIMALLTRSRRGENQKIVVLLPPKDDLLMKWKREAEKALRLFEPKVFAIGVASYPKYGNDGKIMLNGNGKPRTGKRPIQEIQEAFDHEGLTVILLKETTAKMNSGWEPISLRERKFLRLIQTQCSIPPEKMKNVAKSRPAEPVEEARPAMNRELGRYLYWPTTEKDGRLHKVMEYIITPTWDYFEGYTRHYCPHCGIEYVAEELDIMLANLRPRPDPPHIHCRYCGYDWAEVDDDKNIHPVTDPRQVDPASMVKLNEGKPSGKGQLFQRRYDHNGNKQYELAKYVRTYYPNRYVLIVDECHRSKALDSNISYATTDLVSGAWKTIQMTGTLLNGMSSSVFKILYRSSDMIRANYRYNEVNKFITDFGYWQTEERLVEDTRRRSGSGYRLVKSPPREVPGIAPTMACQLLPYSAFLNLEDLGFAMPDYSEHLFLVEPDEDIEELGEFLDSAKQSAIDMLRNKPPDQSGIAQWNQARIGMPNIPTAPDKVAETWWNGLTPLDGDLFPKEEALLRLILQEREEERKVLVFVPQIVRRDPTPRLLRLMGQYNLSGRVMYQKVKHRMAFLAKAAEQVDAAFCSPELVSEGVDLHMYATIIFYGPNFNAITVAQACRRIFRLMQTKACKIIFLGYNAMPETEALDWIARKMKAMQQVRGTILAGLPAVMGHGDLISELEDIVNQETRVRLDSDMFIDDLPALYVAKANVLTIPKPPVVLTPPVGGAQQGSLFTIDKDGTIEYTAVLVKTRNKSVIVEQFTFL